MARLEIEHHQSKWMPKIPHKILINGQLIGIMQTDNVNIEMPEGHYHIMVQSMLKWFYSSINITVERGVRNVLHFGDREKIWDSLFWIAMIMEFVHMFITLPLGWNIAYHVVDDGMFLVWIIYEVSIRKRYFKLDYAHLVANQES